MFQRWRRFTDLADFIVGSVFFVTFFTPYRMLEVMPLQLDFGQKLQLFHLLVSFAIVRVLAFEIPASTLIPFEPFPLKSLVNVLDCLY